MIESHPGSWSVGGYALPDFGITEKIQQYVNPGSALTPSGGSNLYGPNPTTQNNYVAPATVPPGATPPPDTKTSGTTTKTGSVLGTSTNLGNNLEPTPTQPQVNWDEIYKPAFDAMDQAAQSTQSSYSAGLNEATTGTEQRKAELAAEEANRMQNFGNQRSTETKRTEGAVAEARRMASQLLQGLQSQYGGSTGTGAFRGEQLGAAASSNIAGNREALQTAMTGIAQSETALKNKVMELQKKEDDQLEQTKLNLRASLDSELNKIAQTKGQLSVDKGRQRYEALNQYQQAVRDVEARNTAFRQGLYVTAQAHQQALNKMKADPQAVFQAYLKTVNLQPGQALNVGDKSYMPVPTASGAPNWLSGEGTTTGTGIVNIGNNTSTNAQGQKLDQFGNVII